MNSIQTFSACAALLPAVAMVAPAFADIEWTTDLEAAKKEAAQQNKLILIEFTGTDWCTYCVLLHKNVIATPAFEAFMQPLFVPVQIDVPIRADFDKELLARNKALCKQLKVPGYPTLMVLTPEGRVVGGFSGNVAGIDVAKRELTAACKFAKLLAAADKLKGVEKARALHQVYTAMQPALRPASGLRDQIFALDPDNLTGIHAELQVEQQRADFRRELEATHGNAQAALSLVERYLTEAASQNRSEILQAKCEVLQTLVKTEEDVLELKALMLEIAELRPDRVEQTKALIEQRFANPKEMLNIILRNQRKW